MDPVVSVQNKDCTGDGEKLVKILGAVTQAKSHLYCQLARIWQIL